MKSSTDFIYFYRQFQKANNNYIHEARAQSVFINTWFFFQPEEIKRANRLWANDSLFLRTTLHIPLRNQEDFIAAVNGYNNNDCKTQNSDAYQHDMLNTHEQTELNVPGSGCCVNLSGSLQSVNSSSDSMYGEASLDNSSLQSVDCNTDSTMSSIDAFFSKIDSCTSVIRKNVEELQQHSK